MSKVTEDAGHALEILSILLGGNNVSGWYEMIGSEEVWPNWVRRVCSGDLM